MQQGQVDKTLRHFKKSKDLEHPGQFRIKQLPKLTPSHEEKMETNLIEAKVNNDILTPNLLPVGE
jgi:hypothetical protein